MGCQVSKVSEPESKAEKPKVENKVEKKADSKGGVTVFVLGGPGSGKGTQCEKIKARYEGVVHLSAGDLLRAEAAGGSDVGKHCAELMKEGKLVPLEITIGLLKKAMAEKEGQCYLIDGFPRAQDQATKFEADIGLPGAVLFFDCPEDEMEKRLLKRGETSGRSDDNTEAIRKRFKTFVEESKPVQGYYENKGLAHVISAIPAPDDVFQEVIKVLDPMLKQAPAKEEAAPEAPMPAPPAEVAPAPEDPAPEEPAAPAGAPEEPAPPVDVPEEPASAADAPHEQAFAAGAPEELVPEAAAEPEAHMALMDVAIVFVLGGPGSGKGTQCEKIKQRYQGVVHLSAGDLLRAEAASGSEVGEQCAAIMKEGGLVPVSVTIGLLKAAMEKNREGMKMVLIDGFPRALDQAARFENDISLPTAVLFFECPEEEMEKRLLKRGETSGRSDDNAEAIRKRFKTFVEESLPVKGHYADKGRAHAISAVPPPDEVFEEVVKVLDNFGTPL